MIKYTFQFLFIFITFLNSSIAQTNAEVALIKGKEAIKLMDDNKIVESRKLLEEAEQLDPKRFDYPYELAYTYYLEKNYEEAIKKLEKVADHKEVQPQLFQLLGNSYDLLNKPEKAIEKYNDGLKKFPKSGMLYLEIGNVLSGRKSEDDGIEYYEKGIELDPNFSSNYYWASKYYCKSTEEVWGIMYGEIFINLERNSKRTSEISKLLFDTYKSQIKFTSASEVSTSFCQKMSMDINQPNKLPFCLIYEPILAMSINGVSQIDLNTLDIIRTNFVKNYFRNESLKKQPNVLFQYQKTMLENGNLEAYNHWLLLMGDTENFNSWKQNNLGKWENFTKWFKENKIELNDTNKFHQSNY